MNRTSNLLVSLVLCSLAAVPALAVSRTWTGTAGSSFSAAANWFPAGTPGPTDALTFPAVITTQSVNMDLPAGTSVGPLTFGANYTISGNAVTLTADITANKDVTWSSDVKFGGPITLFTNSGATIRFNGAVDVNGQSVKAYKVQFTGTINGGGSITTGSAQFPLYVGAGGNFNGSFVNGGGGSISPYFGTLSNATVNMDSFVWAGLNSSVGDLTVNSITSNGVLGVFHTKSFQFGSGTFELYWSNGNSLSNGQPSTIQVTGSVALNGGQLKINNLLPPLAGQTVLVIDNDGTDAVNGTFANLPEGGKFYLFGTYGISYHGGDGNDVVITRLVDDGTTSKLTQSSAESNYHEPVTFTVTVTSASNSGTPTGRVVYYFDISGGSPPAFATLQNGVATLTTSTLDPGSHTIDAFYEGDVGFAASFTGNPVLKHSVLRALSATTISSTVASTTYGLPVPLKVNVGPKTAGEGQPAGTVNIIADGAAAGGGTLVNGAVTINSSSIHAGTKSVTAVYNGDARFQPSTSSPITLTVNRVSTTLDTRPPSLLYAGAPSTMKVIVTPTVGNGSITAGTITIKEDTATLASADASGNTDVALPPLTLGHHTLQVLFSGSADCEPSSAAVTLNAVSAPKLSVHGADAREGNSGLTPVSVTVTLSEASADTVKVSFHTVDGSAVAGVDYQAASGVITFAPGETAKTIELKIIGDTNVEGTETFSVVLTDPSSATLDAASAVVIIDNDDGPPRRRPVGH